MTNPTASPTWQGILFFVGACFLAWETWRGWRGGIVRSGLNFVAFVASGFLGYFGGQIVAAGWGLFSPGSAVVAGLVAGVSITLFVFGSALFLSALIFKRTGQQPSATIRFFYGGGGAIFGFLTGVAIVLGGVSLIRACGALAESAIHARPTGGVPSVLLGAATLKESLELGAPGRVVQSLDVISPQGYETITRIGELSANPEAMTRFMDDPGVQKILRNPKMAALLSDPAVVRAAERHDLFSLMRSKALLDAAGDPEFQKLLMGLDLQKALDYALPKAHSSPTPANPAKKP